MNLRAFIAGLIVALALALLMFIAALVGWALVRFDVHVDPEHGLTRGR